MSSPNSEASVPPSDPNDNEPLLSDNTPLNQQGHTNQVLTLKKPRNQRSKVPRHILILLHSMVCQSSLLAETEALEVICEGLLKRVAESHMQGGTVFFSVFDRSGFIKEHIGILESLWTTSLFDAMPSLSIYTDRQCVLKVHSLSSQEKRRPVIHLNILSYNDSKGLLVDFLVQEMAAKRTSTRVSVSDIEDHLRIPLGKEEILVSDGSSSHFPEVDLTLVWGVSSSNLTLNGCPPWLLHSTELMYAICCSLHLYVIS